MAGAAFAACSSSDDSIAEQQPVNPTEAKTYTMTVQVTKGDAAGTRSIMGTLIHFSSGRLLRPFCGKSGIADRELPTSCFE